MTGMTFTGVNVIPFLLKFNAVEFEDGMFRGITLS